MVQKEQSDSDTCLGDVADATGMFFDTDWPPVESFRNQGMQTWTIGRRMEIGS